VQFDNGSGRCCVLGISRVREANQDVCVDQVGHYS
jgi:hypothetical protein